MQLRGRIGFCSAFLSAALLTDFLLSGEPSQKSIPDTKAQAKVEALLQELFKEDYAKAAQDPVARVRLANTFLSEGRDTDDDRAGRYVLFREARDLAAHAGDTTTAFQAIEDLAKDFGLTPRDVFQMKSKALMTASKAVANPDAYYTVVDSALVLLEDALAADDFDAARELTDTAKAAAVKLRNVPLVSSVVKRQEEVLRLEKDYEKWRPFAQALLKDPKNPPANTEMGRYHAFRKGNWELGLTLLARGADPGLRGLALMELKQPKAVGEQLKLAQGWLQAAEDAADPSRTQILLRAYYWLQQALPQLEGKAQRDVEKRMLAIMARVPPEFRVGEILEEYRRYEGNSGAIYAVAFSPDGRKAAFGGADNVLHLWDTKIGKEIRSLQGHSGRIWTVAFSTDGRTIASGGFDKTIRLWDVASGREKRLAGHKDYVRSVAFSRDGKYLVSGGDDRVVRIWDVETGGEVSSFPGHEHFVWSVAYAPDGKHVLSGGLDKGARLWNISTGKEVAQLMHQDTVMSVAFSPEGRRALSASTDGTIKLWDLINLKELKTLSGHKGYVHSVAFAPDGRRALSAGQDHSVRLWDLTSGEEVRRLDGHRDQVWSVAFSRDGRLALSAGQDGTVRVWGGAR